MAWSFHRFTHSFIGRALNRVARAYNHGKKYGIDPAVDDREISPKEQGEMDRANHLTEEQVVQDEEHTVFGGVTDHGSGSDTTEP